MEDDSDTDFIFEVLTVIVVHIDEHHLLLHDLLQRRLVATQIWKILSIALDRSFENLRELLLTLIVEVLSHPLDSKFRNWTRLAELGIHQLRENFIVQEMFNNE